MLNDRPDYIVTDAITSKYMQELIKKQYPKILVNPVNEFEPVQLELDLSPGTD